MIAATRQDLAILVDSVRLLRSRALFWLSLGISALAAAVLFGTYSFNDQGIRFFWFDTIENPMLRAGTDGPRTFVAGIYNGVFVKFWLSWGAIILAIISTSSILPEFLSSGSIELSLSKPISRVRLFVVKAVGAMAFVGVQVSVSVLLAYLLIGVKFNLWLHASLLSIPLITLQYFYIYCASALIAVMTRSTLACVIGTVLFWFALFIIQFASGQLQTAVVQSEVQLQRAESRIEAIKAHAQEEGRDPTPLENVRLSKLEADASGPRSLLSTLRPWRDRLKAAETGIPKTGQIQTILANVTHAPVLNEFVSLLQTEDKHVRPHNISAEDWEEINAASTAAQKALRDVDTWKSIATSSAFSLSVFAAAAIIFRRKDF